MKYHEDCFIFNLINFFSLNMAFDDRVWKFKDTYANFKLCNNHISHATILIVRNQIPGRQFKRLKLQSGNLIFVVELKSIFLLLKNWKKKKNCESTMNFHYSQIIIINYFCNLYKIEELQVSMKIPFNLNRSFRLKIKSDRFHRFLNFAKYIMILNMMNLNSKLIWTYISEIIKFQTKFFS